MSRYAAWARGSFQVDWEERVNFIMLFIGHGIGVSPNEPPYIGEVMAGSSEVTLEPGMVFAVEPLIFLPDVRGGGGVRLEDTVLITEDGPRPMTRAPFCRELLGG
ncbi:MAG: M24 family metallopeptidase [Nitrospinota bacterium]